MADKNELPGSLDLAKGARALNHKMQATLAEQAKELARLKDIIRREAWLEDASAEDLPSPYVPWSTYSTLLGQAVRFADGLNDIGCYCGDFVACRGICPVHEAQVFLATHRGVSP